VFLATDVDGVFDVADQVLCRRLPLLAEGRHQVDARDTAPCGKQAQFLVALVARVGGERGTPGMTDRERVTGRCDRVQRGALASMREVDQPSAGIDLLDQLAAESTQPRIGGLKAAVTDQIAAIVGQLVDAHAQPMEGIETFNGLAEGRRIQEKLILQFAWNCEGPE